jgi:predicted metal-dependent hydrolase
MSKLLIRKLDVDLSQGFARHWHSGDAFRSQYHNALSMSFPIGEQSFIDAVREGVKLLPDTAATPELATRHATLRADVAQFIGQEATHRHMHGLYNAQLEAQGLVNHWQHWAARRIAFGHKINIDVRHLLAITAAYEHFTAVFADGTLRYGSWFDGAEPTMRTLWRWHAAEETEHRSVAFDLYQAVGGSHAWRIRWYLYVCVLFTLESMGQTLINLWHDGSLFKPRTWWGALTFFWGKNSVVWRCTGPLLRYFRRDFHPDQERVQPTAQALASDWLSVHAGSYRVVR